MASTFSRASARHARCRLCHLICEYPADAASPLGWLAADLCGECATIYREGRRVLAVRPLDNAHHQWIVATAKRRSTLAVMDTRFSVYPAAHLAQQSLDAHAALQGLEEA